MLERVLVSGGSGFIGTSLVGQLTAMGVNVINVDISAPLDRGLYHTWVKGDVLEKGALRDIIEKFQPTHVVHLAARVDIRGRTLEEYRANYEGTANLLDVVGLLDHLRRVIVVSTQFVVAPGHTPVGDTDYQPHTAYGMSKVEAERATRNSELPWVIVRPTTIYGPFDLAYRRQFYWALDRGLYLHPRSSPCFRSFGFVGNLVDQMIALLTANDKEVLGRTFYLGDPVMNVVEFADAFSQRMTGKPVRMVPSIALLWLARLGDVGRRFHLPTPITTSRYRSMTEDYLVPLTPTFEVTGYPRYALEEAVELTLAWLENEGSILKRARQGDQHVNGGHHGPAVV